MKLLLDQGLPRSAAMLLKNDGIDTLHVGEIGLSIASDNEILFSFPSRVFEGRLSLGDSPSGRGIDRAEGGELDKRDDFTEQRGSIPRRPCDSAARPNKNQTFAALALISPAGSLLTGTLRNHPWIFSAFNQGEVGKAFGMLLIRTCHISY